MATGSAGPAVRIVRRASFLTIITPLPSLSLPPSLSWTTERTRMKLQLQSSLFYLFSFSLFPSVSLHAVSSGAALWVDNGSPCFHFTRSQKWPQTASLSLTHTSNSLRAFDHIHNKTQANVSPLPLMRLSWLRVHQRTSVWLSTHTHTHTHTHTQTPTQIPGGHSNKPLHGGCQLVHHIGPQISFEFQSSCN